MTTQESRPQEAGEFIAKFVRLNQTEANPNLAHISPGLRMQIQERLDELAQDDKVKAYFSLLAQPRIQQLLILDEERNLGVIDNQTYEAGRQKLLESHPDAPIAIEFVKKYLVDKEPEVRSGVLFEKRPKTGRRSVSQEALNQRDEQVKALRDEGLENTEIAKRLDIGWATVARSVRRLLASGEITDKTSSKRHETRGKVLRALQQHQKNHPDELVALSDVARELDISYERVRALYLKLAREGHDLPLKRSHNVHELLDRKVGNFLEQGLSLKEIAEKMDIALSAATASRMRLIKSGKIQQ